MSTRIVGWLAKRLVGGFLVLILAAPTARAAAAPWQETVPAQQEQSAANAGAQHQTDDDVNGKASTNPAPPDANLPDAPEVAQSSGSGSGGQNENPQPSPDQSPNQQQNGAPQPVGTAAAPSEPATGVAASRPAGAAIAPAKQRRVRTILISLGVVAAACVAVGVVVGLSHTSPGAPK